MLQSHLTFLSLLHGQYVEVLKNILKLLLTRTSKISIEFLKHTNVLLLQKSDDSPQNKEYQTLLQELNGIKESSSYYMLLIQIATVMQKKYVNKAFEALFELFQSSYQSNDPDTKAHYQALRKSLETEDLVNLNFILAKDNWVMMRFFFISLEIIHELR
jgi:hypothetical protein